MPDPFPLDPIRKIQTVIAIAGQAKKGLQMMVQGKRVKKGAGWLPNDIEQMTLKASPHTLRKT
jgi:hypothetical protein